MVKCERCHKKFSSYAGLAQHYGTRHPNVKIPTELEDQVVAEKESKEVYKVALRPRGNSRVRIAVFLLIVMFAVSVTGYVAFTPRETVAKKIGVGAVAPDFTLPDVSGGTFKLSDYRGKSNVLLFFNEGLSCQPCLRQMQDLDQLNEQFTNLNVVAVSITGDSINLLSDWARSSGPRFSKVLSDQSLQVSKAYDMLGADVSMMPGTAPGHSFVLVNKSGVIVWRGDFGPYNMSVPNEQIIAAVKQALRE